MQTFLAVPAPLAPKNLFFKQSFKMFLCINTLVTKLKTYSVAVLGYSLTLYLIDIKYIKLLIEICHKFFKL